MNTVWAVNALIEKLKAPDPFVRIHAATLLGWLGDEAERAVPALIELLQNGVPQDRSLAALTLGEIGPAAAEALPFLGEATDDEDDGVATIALDALGRIDCNPRHDKAA